MNKIYTFLLLIAVSTTMVTAQNSKTKIERVAERMQTQNPLKKIGVFADTDPEQISIGAIGLLLDKLRTMKSFEAVRQRRKINEFKRAHRRMGPS